MKRLNRLAVLALILLVVPAVVAAATPNPNSAVVKLRIWNDCPLSILTWANNYPAQIWINDDMHPLCVGYANFHNWSLSADGMNPLDFPNDSNVRFGFTYILGGEGVGEGGLRVAPWWSLDTDAKFMVNSVSGEIAVFGGRLPFYSFTANHGLTYVKGTPIGMEITYLANGLNSGSPATIEYKVYYPGPYSSGPIAFDLGNPSEDPPHGVWGWLQPTQLGGWFQPYAGQSQGGNVFSEWNQIYFQNFDPVPVESTSWGRVKNMYQ
jgi:hypothetical protein